MPEGASEGLREAPATRLAALLADSWLWLIASTPLWTFAVVLWLFWPERWF